MHCFCTGFLYLCSGLIQNVMAKNLLNKYVWLVETIYKAKKITFEEINEKWMDEEQGYDEKTKTIKPLSLRTFHKWRQNIEQMFGLIIENEKGGHYYYYIQNADDLKDESSLRSWLFRTLSVSNMMLDSVCIKDKILLEEVHDGREYLSVILESLKKNIVLEMTYQSYWRDEANTFEIEPYCLKAFKQRWYLVARSPYYNKVMIYALDRVEWLGLTDKSFKYPKDFNSEVFFSDCFGIIVDPSVKVETVKFKVSAAQANYLRSLRLHQTQKEIDRTDEYSIFTVRLRPTYDFRQEILSQGSDIEVLEPKWFRDEVAGISRCVWNKYKSDK